MVDLVKYPVNQPAITIDDAEGASKAALTAVYKSDGTLAVSYTHLDVYKRQLFDWW